MPASRLSGPIRPRLEALESRENPATVTWDLAPSEITTDSGNKTRDTTLTYVADYSTAPSVTPTARSYTITNGRVISVTPDSTDSTIFYVDIAPKTGGRAPVTVTSFVNSGWTSGGPASSTETISFFRNENQIPRTATGSNPKGILPSSLTTLSNLVFTFPSDINRTTVSTGDFLVTGGSITLIAPTAGDNRTISLDLTITATGGAAEVSITLRPGAIEDTYGNTFKPAPALRWTKDDVAPTATLSIASGTGEVGKFVTVDVAFSETITNFKADMISISQGGTTIVPRVSGSRAGWSFRFRVPTTGAITITLNTSGTVGTTLVGDRSGNALSTSSSLSVTGFIAS
jgi:hypothetical protein